MINTRNIKELTSVVTCYLAFFIGFGLTIAGFCVPPVGVVSDSILWVLGQTLLYCGAILGISNHYECKLQNFETKVLEKIGRSNETNIKKDF